MKGGIVRARCDICNKGIKGFAYRCSNCSFMMHPCCALLSTEMQISAHRHPIRLLSATTKITSTPSARGGGGGDPAVFACAHCQRKRSGRVYRCMCTDCDYHLHAVCAKSMVNGLHANGIEAPPEKPSMLGAAARIASHAVIGFVGGLIEGIGEGFGEVLIQSITKARSRNN